ncbi:MAG: hypothetical protein Q9169_004601 [Polycauliona sp. 2 TL-2023]
MAQREPDKQGLANQGQPLGSTNQGMKHTTDPEAYQNPTVEGPGAIASDSLAAESTRSGGAFSSNRNPEPLAQSGSTSTFNNTDTSGARVLDAAPDAAEREAKEAWSEVPAEARGVAGQKYPEGAGNVEFSGTHNTDGYAGGPSDAKREVGESGYTPSGIRGGAAPAANYSGEDFDDDDDNSYTPSGIRGGAAPGSNDDDEKSSSSSKADTAPGYVASVHSDPAQTGKPHGKNIKEGGPEFDEGENTSFSSEIGTKEDPGRAAEEQFQTTAQTSAGGKGKPQSGLTKDGQYDVLETDQNL